VAEVQNHRRWSLAFCQFTAVIRGAQCIYQSMKTGYD
jgi:hypothetical protein